MVRRKQQGDLRQEAWRQQMLRGEIDRRELLTRSLAAGLGVAGVSVAAKFGIGTAHADRPLTPTFYQWIEDLHPGIPKVNAQFPGINYQIAPVEGFGIERFVAEAKKGESTWDVYVGMTPFVEMTAMIQADVIEPWDKYIPKEVIDDIIPSIRQECTVDGKLYSWPFLLDVIGMGWHSGLATKAGLPDTAPETWDDYLQSAQKIVDSGAAPFGATFDAHGWRSLAPMTHSLSTDVYTSEGLFDFTSDPAIEALMLMKKIMALANPDILLAGTSDAGVNGTPDEVAFAAQRVGYYTKYFNAPLRMAQYWQDPTLLKLAPLPKFAKGAGSTVFWTTGSCLLKYGQNKEKAAEYIKTLTYDPQIWKDFDRRHGNRAPGATAALRLDLRRLGDQPARLDAGLRGPRARSARPRQGDHQQPVRPAAVRDRAADLGDLPEGRGEGSPHRHEEGGRCRARRDAARLTAPGADGRSGPPACLPSDLPRPVRPPACRSAPPPRGPATSWQQP